MILSILRIFPSREQRRHVLSVLRSVQGPTQAQSHCISCHVLEEDGYDEAIVSEEQWETEEDLSRHIRSELYARLLAAAELSRIKPDFKFHYISDTRGMDLIEAARAAAPPEGND